MIIDVPNPADYERAGVNQLYLAWQIAMQAIREFGEVISYGLEDEVEAHAEYWQRLQPALANAYSLIQQGMELALKGRIAAISPFLLIGDPGDWPARAAFEDVSFGELRTLDAADLFKVHNSVCATDLSDEFRSFWDDLRRERNKIMHSAAARSFDPGDVVRAILTAINVLFPQPRWPARLLEMENDGRFAVLGLNDDVQNNVMGQVESALHHLSPAQAQLFFGFDKKRRAYVCPRCYYAANRDWQDVWPHLAQFTTKVPRATELGCIVCEQVTIVDREPCEQPECKGDVLAEGLCLTCLHTQEGQDA